MRVSRPTTWKTLLENIQQPGTLFFAGLGKSLGLSVRFIPVSAFDANSKEKRKSEAIGIV